MSNVDVQVLTVNDAKNDPFQPIDALPNELKPASMQVLKFSQRYLKLETDKKWFDWAGFKKAADDYPGSDLVIAKFNQSTIIQQSQTASVMVDKVAKFLSEAFSASIDKSKIAAIILNTFTNLKEKGGSGFMQFSSNKEKNNSSWEYRVLFSVPFENDGAYFYSLVTTITITADVVEQSSWWGLTSSTSKNFGVEINIAELVVEKGFKAPIN